MAEQYRSEKSIFLAAIEKTDASERAAYLDGACGDNLPLRAEVEALFRAHEKPHVLLDVPVPAGQTVDGPPFAEQPGTVIGPYKLLQQIGEGGMGTVFMAEQTQPVQRKVALKVIKAGMDSRQVIARFEAERQALAMMDHVNIARVLDAGTTEAGRPYFVMELVHGVPITKYCDDNRLTPRQRLELFVPVCQAIQHAHQKGIIHRDVKPSNVMIALYDGKPVPKIIDFGVAKATEQKLTERTLFTQYGTMVGTPQYMSPEQAEMSALGVDTRSDIYSLGVLLYELLTGSTPLTQKRLKEAAYGEILRMIKEEEPPKPSTRLSESGDALASISIQRQMESVKLTKLMRGELDWIVMKTLEKDRNRRYETANAFAADVQRYLKDEAVHACPPSASYRFRKFARKNKAALTTAALVVAALLVGAIASTWQAVRATQAETQAKANEARALGEEQKARANLKKARAAVDQMLVRVAGRLANVPHMEQVRRELLEDSLKFYAGFLQEHSTDPDVRFETGLAYIQFGEMQNMLGEDRPAEQAYVQAIRIFQELANRSPDKADYRHNLAHSHNKLGNLIQEHGGRMPEAEQAYRQALAITRKLDADFPNKYRGWVAGRLNNVGIALNSTGRLAEAESAHREALAIRLEPGQGGALEESYRNLFVVLYEAGRLAEAEQSLRQALALLEKRAAQAPYSAAQSSTLSWIHFYLGGVLMNNGRFAEGEKAYRESLAIAEKLTADFPNVPWHRDRLADGHHNLAQLLRNTDRLPEAESAYRRAGDICEKLVSEFPGTPEYSGKLVMHIGDLGCVLLDSGQPGEAEKLIRRSIASAEKLTSDLPNVKIYQKALGFAHGNLGMVHYRRADWKAAAASLKKCFQLVGDAPEATDCQFFLAMAYWQVGDKEQAEKSYDQAVQWMDKHNPHDQRLRRFRAEAAELLNEKSGDPDRK